ncbi:MAG: hypothetical protein GX543_00720 [Gordonia sp.]|nr:hypothetical protein [Gordonia sp. (in: high G+C Gram-positive bacteria)]
MRNRLLVSILTAATLVGAVTGCSGADDAPLPLTALVLESDALPAGYTLYTQATVDELIGVNRRTLEQAETVEFRPEECRPTADADFNPRLTSENTVLLVAQSESGTLSEVVSTVVRDLGADRRATTGACRIVTAVPTRGTLATAEIVTRNTELTGPRGDFVKQSVVVRSDTVTTLGDGGVRVRSALLSNVLVQRPDGQTVTVQLNVAGPDSAVQPTAPEAIDPPLSDAEFTELVQQAAERAAR